MNLRGLRVTKNAYFSLLKRTKELLLVTFCDTIARIGRKEDKFKGLKNYVDIVHTIPRSGSLTLKSIAASNQSDF